MILNHLITRRFNQSGAATLTSKTRLKTAFYIGAFALFASLPVSTAQAGDRLTTAFTPGRCLDIIKDGKNNRLTMAACGRFTGQNWTRTPAGAPGTYTIRNQFSGPHLCLDVVNDGQNNKVIMAPCGGFTGQTWTGPTAHNPGQFRNKFTGAAKCLDIINDGQNNKPTLANCANVTGQFWRPSAF